MGGCARAPQLSRGVRRTEWGCEVSSLGRREMTALRIAALFAFCMLPASQRAAETDASNSPGKPSTLVSKNAEVRGLAVNSIEGKPMHGHLVLKPLAKGEQMTMLELHYEAGAKAPLHTHSHESLIYVVKGQVKTTIGDESFVLNPGDVARHPQGVLHTVEALVESTVVEVKSPAPDVASFAGTSERR